MKRYTAMALIGALLSITSPAVTAQARTETAAAPQAGTRIQNHNTQKCVDIPGGIYEKGHPNGPVEHFECRLADNQKFTFEYRANAADGSQLWWIRNDTDGLCLDLPDAGYVPEDSKVAEYHCRDHDNQFWSGKLKIWGCSPQCGDYYLLQNYYWDGGKYVTSGYCLDVPGFGDAGDGARLQVHTCISDRGDDHYWTW